MADKSSLPEPCLADERPACSARSSDHLARMLAGQIREVLPEWLAALAQSGRRVREEDLVSLLEQGRSQRDLRQAIVLVIGKRGRWLAAQNPDWSYATGRENTEGDWQTASREWRLDELKRCRVSDPARARELVASTWDQETPPDRAAFLETFAVGLSMDDEPFLESALDDKRAEVRRAAADLLSRLAESRLCQRMIARVGPLVQFSQHKGKLQIDINLPDQYTKDMARDGVEKKIQGMGEKNGWLDQMIAIVPPSYWCRVTGKSPAELLEAAGRLGMVAGPDRSLGPRPPSDTPARTGSRPCLEACYRVQGFVTKDLSLFRWSSRSLSQTAAGPELLITTCIRYPEAAGTIPLALSQRPRPALGDGAVPCRHGIRSNGEITVVAADSTDVACRILQVAGCRIPVSYAEEVEDQLLVATSIRPSAHVFKAITESLDASPFPPRDAFGATAMTMTAILREHAEQQFAEELAELEKADDRTRPPKLAAFSLGGRHLPPGRDLAGRLRGLAQVHRQPPADRDRHRHPGHRSGPAAAGRAGNGQELGLGASRGGNLGRLDAPDPGHGRHQRGSGPVRLELRTAARRRAVAPGPGAQPSHGGDGCGQDRPSRGADPHAGRGSGYPDHDPLRKNAADSRAG